MALEEQDQLVLWLLWPHVVLAIRASWEVVSWARFHPWGKLIGVFPWCRQRLTDFTGLNRCHIRAVQTPWTPWSSLNRSYLCGAASSSSKCLLHHLPYPPPPTLQGLEVYIYIERENTHTHTYSMLWNHRLKPPQIPLPQDCGTSTNVYTFIYHPLRS